jgi:hypothetical protein
MLLGGWVRRSLFPLVPPQTRIHKHFIQNMSECLAYWYMSIPSSSGSLVITVKVEGKENPHTTAILFFNIL